MLIPYLILLHNCLPISLVINKSDKLDITEEDEVNAFTIRLDLINDQTLIYDYSFFNDKNNTALPPPHANYITLKEY